MRPFECPVTILNTIDHLGKFNGKAAEGFFVGYSLNSKAFRVHSLMVLQSNQDDGSKSSSDDEKKVDEDPRKDSESIDQEKDDNVNSTNNVNAANTNKANVIEVKTASTPIETQKPLLKDEDGEEVDVHMYRSMIGSLMYLTSLRPDIMFVVCLWYLKDSPFDLVAYTNSDYAGASLDRKSTTWGGRCQFP
ncbi:uncharacterized mitochondrial protein-like protein [Tanacetum coccineum]